MIICRCPCKYCFPCKLSALTLFSSHLHIICNRLHIRTYCPAAGKQILDKICHGLRRWCRQLVAKNSLSDLKYIYTSERFVNLHYFSFSPCTSSVCIWRFLPFQIASVAKDGRAVVWNVSTGKKAKELQWVFPNGTKYLCKRCRCVWSYPFTILPVCSKRISLSIDSNPKNR